MATTISVDPVTRIEGHGKITVMLDDQGKVADARFCVKEFRGFEKFCEGALAERLPLITSRICGICPISHHLASTKAIEDCFGTEIPPTAKKLRELMALGQLIESHMLSVALLSLPDLIFGDGTSGQRNIIGIYQSDKEVVGKALELRGVGTALCRIIGRRPGHPIGARIGGVVSPLTQGERAELLGTLTAAEPHLTWLAHLLHSLYEKNAEVIQSLGDIRTAYMGLSQHGNPAFYDGDGMVLSEDGNPITRFKASEYFDHIEEKIEDWSYMKFPMLKSGQRFRVGPLARVNIAEEIPTSMADQELSWFRERWPRPAHKTLCYHYARYIEVIYAFERIKELLHDPEITNENIFNKPTIRAGTGIGVVEAPRGTLVHRYELDEDGKAVRVDLLVATQHNNFGFNDALKETASKLITNPNPDEAVLNKLEMIVRAYDPCLSCSTHAVGYRSFKIELVDHQFNIIKEW